MRRRGPPNGCFRDCDDSDNDDDNEGEEDDMCQPVYTKRKMTMRCIHKKKK